MIHNPFISIGSIFSEISQRSSWNFWQNDEPLTQEKMTILSAEIIDILQHPHSMHLKTSDLFKLRNQIVHLRQSPSGKNNYAKCETTIQKIETAIDNYGKKISIGSDIISNSFSKEMTELIHIFNKSDKTPLSIVYKLQNLSDLSTKDQIKLATILLKTPSEEFLHLILKTILKSDKKSIDSSLFDILSQQLDGGFTLLKCADLVFDSLKSSGSSNLPRTPSLSEIPSSLFNSEQNKNLFILKMMALFIDPDQEIDPNIFVHLFSKITDKYTEEEHTSIISRIPKKNRIQALAHAACFFSNQLELWEKLTYVLEVSLSPNNQGVPLQIAALFEDLKLGHYFIAIQNIPLLPLDSTYAKELLEESKVIMSKNHNPVFFLYERLYKQRNNKHFARTIDVMFNMTASKSKRAACLAEIDKLFTYFNLRAEGEEIALFVHILSQTQNDSEMRDLMQNICCLLNNNLIDIFQPNFLVAPYTLIASIPRETRGSIIDQCVAIGSYFDEDDQFRKTDILATLLLFSEEELNSFLSISSDIKKILWNFPFHITNNFALEFSLFFTAIHSNKELVEKLKSGKLRTGIDKKKFIDLIILTAEKKISNINIPKEALMSLCNFLYYNQEQLHLFHEHPLIIKVSELLTTRDLRGAKDPFVLHQKLLKLANEPVSFKPAAVSIEGKTVHININAWSEMSKNISISRKEIPEEATLEAFNALMTNLINKHANNPSAFEEALQMLNPSLSAAKILQSSSLSTLRGLLTLTSDNVTENEAKWRKILSNILSKSTKTNKDFFTEQESVQITTQYAIQHCLVGIAGGIDDVYQDLPSKFKYNSVQLLAKTNTEFLEDTNQNSALHFLTNWIRNNSHKSFDDLSILLVKEDPKTLITFLPALIGYDLSLWDVRSEDPEFIDSPIDDPSAKWYLTLEGAKATLHHVLKTKAKVREILVPILQGYVTGIFNRGNEKLVKHFIGDIQIEQSIHQTTYIKNLIGHLLGLTKAITPDMQSALIYEELTDASRDEMLEAFFTYHPPVEFIKEVKRVINLDKEACQNSLPSYFNQPAFWDKQTGITTEGTLELLIQSEFFTKMG